MRFLTTAIALLPLISAIPVPDASVSAANGAAPLLLVPTTTNAAFPSDPVALAYGCLDASGSTLKGATTAAAGCGLFLPVGSTMKGEKGMLKLVQKSPYPLAADSTVDSKGAFGLFLFPVYPGWVFYGDFANQFYTGGQTNADEIHLNTVPNDKKVSLYFTGKTS